MAKGPWDIDKRSGNSKSWQSATYEGTLLPGGVWQCSSLAQVRVENGIWEEPLDIDGSLTDAVWQEGDVRNYKAFAEAGGKSEKTARRALKRQMEEVDNPDVRSLWHVEMVGTEKRQKPNTRQNSVAAGWVKWDSLIEKEEKERGRQVGLLRKITSVNGGS